MIPPFADNKILAVNKAAKMQPEKFSKLLKKVDNHQISIDRAYKQVEESKRQDELNTSLEQKSLVIPENLTLLNADFNLCQGQIPDGTVQLILTDPPYGEQYLELWEQLGLFASRVLVPGGFLIARARAR